LPWAASDRTSQDSGGHGGEFADRRTIEMSRKY
jgi:hypothetical protein